MTAAVLTRAVIVARSVPMAGAHELTVRFAEAGAAQPGQFFQIGVEAAHTILRRPYSVAWTDERSEEIGFIFNVVGAGSAWLASRVAGEDLELLGPLGHGFELSRVTRAVCVAGGLGVAAFPALVRALGERGRPVTMLQGARSADRLLPDSRFVGAVTRVATDDGSTGRPGPVTDLLADALHEEAEIFTCGPTPMLKSVIRVVDRLGVARQRVQVALETPMGCGVGTCLGCVAPRRGGGYLLTCQEGPCVAADRLDWERMTDAFHG